MVSTMANTIPNICSRFYRRTVLDLVLDSITADVKESLVVLKTRASSREKAQEAIDGLGSFRRAGRDRARFRVEMGSQVEKRDKYPYWQDLRITILDDADGPKKKKKSKRSTG